jgi:hypothetical protein
MHVEADPDLLERAKAAQRILADDATVDRWELLAAVVWPSAGFGERFTKARLCSICEAVEIPVVTSGWPVRYCSDACRAEAHRRQNRAYHRRSLEMRDRREAA